MTWSLMENIGLHLEILTSIFSFPSQSRETIWQLLQPHLVGLDCLKQSPWLFAGDVPITFISEQSWITMGIATSCGKCDFGTTGFPTTMIALHHYGEPTIENTCLMLLGNSPHASFIHPSSTMVSVNMNF